MKLLLMCRGYLSISYPYWAPCSVFSVDGSRQCFVDVAPKKGVLLWHHHYCPSLQFLNIGVM